VFDETIDMRVFVDITVKVVLCVFVTAEKLDPKIAPRASARTAVTATSVTIRLVRNLSLGISEFFD
jgi:hypothetical protein